MPDDKIALKKLLVERSFQFSREPIFVLTSGKKSQYYIDCKATTLFSSGAYLIGKIFFDRIDLHNIRGIGGLTLGADPIALATALVAGKNGKNLHAFIIRKEPKKHGLKKWIEGGISPGDRVVIVEDVITTGSSVLRAIERAEDYGLEIVRVMILVDREEGGRENIADRGYEIESIFTKSTLLEEYEKLMR